MCRLWSCSILTPARSINHIQYGCKHFLLAKKCPGILLELDQDSFDRSNILGFKPPHLMVTTPATHENGYYFLTQFPKLLRGRLWRIISQAISLISILSIAHRMIIKSAPRISLQIHYH